MLPVRPTDQCRRAFGPCVDGGSVRFHRHNGRMQCLFLVPRGGTGKTGHGPRLRGDLIIGSAVAHREKQEHLASRTVFALDDSVTADDSSNEQFLGQAPQRRKPVCTYQRQTFQERAVASPQPFFLGHGVAPQNTLWCRKPLAEELGTSLNQRLKARIRLGPAFGGQFDSLYLDPGRGP